jgi:hypothetical protein
VGAAGPGKSVVNAIVEPIQAAQTRKRQEWEDDRLLILKAHLESLKKELKEVGKDAGQSERNKLAKDLCSAQVFACANNIKRKDVSDACQNLLCVACLNRLARRRSVGSGVY